MYKPIETINKQLNTDPDTHSEALKDHHMFLCLNRWGEEVLSSSEVKEETHNRPGHLAARRDGQNAMIQSQGARKNGEDN